MSAIGLSLVPGLQELDFAEDVRSYHVHVLCLFASLGPFMKRFRRIAAIAGGILLSTLASFVIIELGLRLFDGIPLLSFGNFVAERVDQVRFRTLPQYDPVVGWILKPGLTFRSGDVTIFSGEFGIRMNQAEIMPVPRGGILASGDSFTAGSEVADAQTWPAQLQRRLGRPVNNAAAGGWGVDQIVLRAETLAPILKPNTIITAFTVDSILWNEYRVFGGGGKPYFTIENKELVLHNQPVERLANHPGPLGFWRFTLGYSHLANAVITAAGYGHQWWDPQLYVKTGQDSVKLSCLLLKRMQEFTQARKIRYLVLLQFNGVHLLSNAEPEHALTVVKCARDAGIDIIDTWKPLKALEAEQGLDAIRKLHVMHDDGRTYGHFSSAGNDWIAGLLEERLRNGYKDAVR